MSNESGQNLEKSGEENSKSDEQRNQAENKIHPTIAGESRPPPKVPPANPNENQPENNANPGKPHPPNWCDIATLVIEVLGIIGLGIYCGYTIAEWKTFDSERQTMEREFAASQTNTIEQMKVLRGQLDEMKNGRLLDERAWVVVVAYTNNQTATNISFNVTAKNTGKTPALNFTMWVETQGSTNANGFGCVLPATYPRPEQLQLLPPDGVSSKGTEGKPTDIKIGDLIGAKKTNYFLDGIIKYDDIFTNHHWTRFCWRVEWYKTNCFFYGTTIGNYTDENETNQNNPIPTSPKVVPNSAL